MNACLAPRWASSNGQGWPGPIPARSRRPPGSLRSTFFFHFPTKEHVLIELERREEERIARELTRFFAKPHDVAAALTKTVTAMESLERRLGSHLFKDFLALHFSASRPPQEVWTNHPVMVVVIEELKQARVRGDIPENADPFHSGVFFLVGLYALLMTLPESRALRAPVLEKYVGNDAVWHEPRVSSSNA